MPDNSTTEPLLSLADLSLDTESGPNSANRRNSVPLTPRSPCNVEITGTMSITNGIITLVKTVVGSGVLALSGGIASFSSLKEAVVPAIILVIIMASMSGYCFTLIGRACEIMKASSFNEAWTKAVSPKTVWLVQTALIFCCFSAVLCYEIIIGESIAKLLEDVAARHSENSLITLITSRNFIILLYSVVILLPLSLKENLSDLGWTSTAGVGGLVVTSIVMIIRYVDGTYADEQEIAFNDSDSTTNSGKNVLASINPLISVLCSMLFTAFVGHFAAGRFYFEIEDRSYKRLNITTIGGFSISALITCIIMVMGYLTFGIETEGNILTNYHTDDLFLTFCRIGIIISVTGSFPLTFIAMRECFQEAFNITLSEADMLSQGQQALLSDDNQSSTNPSKGWDPLKKLNFKLTFYLSSVVTVCAIIVQDLGFVIGFFGGIFGSAISFFLPAYLFICAVEKNLSEGKSVGGIYLQSAADKKKFKPDYFDYTEATPFIKFELLLCRIIFVLGIVFGMIGAVTCVYSSFFQE